MRLKICQIIPTLVQGGAEKQMTLLASHLNPAKFESHVIALTHSGPLESELIKAGVQVHVIGKRWKFDPTSYFRLQRLLRTLCPQVVHTWLFAANSYGRLAASKCKVPVIIAGERCVDPWKAWWNHRVDRWALNHTSCFATNTSAVVDFYGRYGIPKQLFEVIPNAIELPTQFIDKAELFRRLNIPPRKIVVGAIGRLWPQKGYPDLIWASELIRIVLRDVWVIVVGDGPQRERLMELRDHYGAGDSLKFVGHRSDAKELLTAFDLLWNGSLYEGQSNTILEALAAGIPVIATDIPGNRDLVKDNENGFLYPVGDVGQLSRLSTTVLSDNQLHQRLCEQAKFTARAQFSLEKMVAAYEDLYLRLYDQSQRHPTKLLRFSPE